MIRHGVKCELCRMSYVQENPDDVREHEEYHDKVVNGLPVVSAEAESDSVIYLSDSMKIVVVKKSSSAKQQGQAEEVFRLARRDTEYDAEVVFGEDELCTHVFLLQRQERNIGLLMVEKRDNVSIISWSDINLGKKPERLPSHPPMWSICFIWILKSCRDCDLGKSMIGAALSYLRVDLENIGWYPTFSETGERLVQRCCPDSFYIVK